MTKAPRKTAEEIKKQKRLCEKAKKPDMPASDKGKMLTLVKMKKAYISWGFKLDPDDNKQQEFIESQGKRMSKCKMLLADGTVTPSYHNIQQGAIRPANTSAEVIKARKEAANAKRSASHKARGLGQKHHYEKETFEALLDVTGLRSVLEYHWMPDGANCDVALKSNDMAAGTYGACELKASDTTDGGQFNFHLSKTDMETKYKGKLIIAIGFKRVNGKIRVTQVFVLSDPKDMPGQSLQPMVDPKRTDAIANLRIRMDGDEQYKVCKNTILEGVLKVPHHTLEDNCFSLEVNRNLSSTHKTEFIGLQFIQNALPSTTTMTMASDKNKTVDFKLHRAGAALGISAKTAVLTYKKCDGSYWGFQFGTNAGRDHHKCDWVLVVYLDESRTLVEGFSVIKGSAVYTDANKGKKFYWNKKGRQKGFDYVIEKHPASDLPRLVDLMFQNRGGQQIIL
ncbi:hypothetical protein JKP88DRAFT_244842 [Tribonema minus]|uniref:Uncharacterized protein n=1 Tax=Tribonema minus TaxID=303371 RepID=A0A835YSD8_9STRA|nr:hypothetical protein JKP88DRAFT_290915 [Tribonema minus]KAG5183970.1 hypothetical protein JKP88DRAFT_244842 [Tribonema minus]